MNLPHDENDHLAKALGQDAITVATEWAEAEIGVSLTVFEARVHNPRAFPYYGAPPSAETTARRIVGRLLDAGWRPPDQSHTLHLHQAVRGEPDPPPHTRWRRVLSHARSIRGRQRDERTWYRRRP
ncbi:hypothetical protein T261_5806 [Streptomyces lydicus]|nr:hypothetical protein T261_5806 [Streptomyces lydicus]